MGAKNTRMNHQRDCERNHLKAHPRRTDAYLERYASDRARELDEMLFMGDDIAAPAGDEYHALRCLREELEDTDPGCPEQGLIRY